MRFDFSSVVVAAVLAATSAFGQDGIEEPVLTPPTPAPPAHVVVPVPGNTEHLPIMTIDQERLFLGSAWGRRAQADIDARLQALSDENDRLVDELAQEEHDLTQLRQTLPAEEFRARADEFDKRVVEVRRERDAKGRELQQTAEKERATFLQAALPILAQMMREKGAVVVLDQRMIFVSADSIDVTSDLIARVDEEAGAGPIAKPAPETPDDKPKQDGAQTPPAAPTSPPAD